jgi:hypothetical protein
MQADHQYRDRRRARHQAASKTKHCNLARGHLLPDKAAFDVLSMGALMGILVGAVTAQKVITNIMVMVPMIMPAMGVVMVFLCETDFKAVDVVTDLAPERRTP